MPFETCAILSDLHRPELAHVVGRCEGTKTPLHCFPRSVESKRSLVVKDLLD